MIAHAAIIASRHPKLPPAAKEKRGSQLLQRVLPMLFLHFSSSHLLILSALGDVYLMFLQRDCAIQESIFAVQQWLHLISMDDEQASLAVPKVQVLLLQELIQEYHQELGTHTVVRGQPQMD